MPRKVIWSPVEEEWLLKHKSLSVNQLSQMLCKSVTAIKNKLKELSLNKSKKKSLQKQRWFVSTKIKAGLRKDLKISTRSGWEANCLRWFNYKKIKWEYEKETFIFNGVKRGSVSYTPDIYLPDQDIWIEVKGYLRSEDKTKIRRLKEYYPEIFSKLQMIIKDQKTLEKEKFYTKMKIPIYAFYNDIKNEYQSKISNWE